MSQDQFHPSFPRPADESVRIWRYMPFERFAWLVESRRLYMPRPVQLEQNDNFEGTMPSAEAAWWDEAMRKAASADKAEIIKANKEKIMGFVRSFRSGWFISCWHMEQEENFAFWEIYGKNADSLAIVTTFAKLESQLPAHVHVGCVRYIDYEMQNFERNGGNLPNLFDYIMHKRSFYRYENEVRAVASAFSPARDGIDANIVNDSYAPLIVPSDLIDEVVVHPRASSDFFERVVEFCATHHLPRPVLSGLSKAPIT